MAFERCSLLKEMMLLAPDCLFFSLLFLTKIYLQKNLLGNCVWIDRMRFQDKCVVVLEETCLCEVSHKTEI